MNRRILTACLILTTSFCSAQGGWNISYIPIDSVNEIHIDRIVRLDFKSQDTFYTHRSERNIRSYFQTRDTGTITIDSRENRFVEHRKIYVDHGNYYDQYLECLDCGQDSILILDAKVLDIGQSEILFQVELETGKAGFPKIKQLKTVNIQKQKLDGLISRNAD